MVNTRTPVVYIGDDGISYNAEIATKYLPYCGMVAPATGNTNPPLPHGIRLRAANIRTYVPASTGVVGHYTERKVHCNISALAAGGTMAKGTVLTALDGTGDTAQWTVQGWTGERRKNIL